MPAYETLTAAIDDLIREKTFSLEGVEAIKKLRDQAAKLQSDLTNARDIIEEKGKELAAARTANAAYLSKEADVAKRETAVKDRELKVTELEKSTAVAIAKYEVLNATFTTIFRNTIVRENINRQVPMPPNPGYMTNVSENIMRETE